MKKIINGRKYDTNTAKFMGKWESVLPVNDFGYSEKMLYKKKNGEFFLYGWGGPASIYRVYEGDNSWRGGEKITPITEKEAKKFAEECFEVSEYEAIFGEVEE